MSIREELNGLRQKYPVLQAETVVRWAKINRRSALHAALDWNDTSAAHQFRLWQVRSLIAIHVVNVEGVRQLVSLKIDRVKDGGGYRDLDTVLQQPDMRDMLLSEALAELERMRLKYETLTELARVWVEAQRVQQRRRVRGRREVRKKAA